MARVLLFIVMVLAVLQARVARAGDDADKARATGLFAEAQALAEAGKLADACPKFEESVKAHAGVGNRFNLADCWEKTGRVASAHALFIEVASVTRELGQTEREQAAIERAKALEPKLVRLRVEVSAPNENVKLERNGTIVDEEQWGKPVPVDPGSYELLASAPGKEAWKTKLEIPSEPGTVLVTVPVLEDAKKPVAVAAAAAPAATKPKKKQPPAVEKESGDGFRQVATISLVGLGVAGVVVGSAMSAQYLANHQDAEAVCPESIGCTQEQVDRHDELVNDARTARTLAFVGFGAGAAALTGAAFLHFTAPSRKERSGTARLRPEIFVSPRGTLGAAVSGGF